MKFNVKCQYCGKKAELVTGAEVYPHRPDLAGKKFYLCKPCNAYVGVHSNSDKNVPLGTLANMELRLARSAVHKIIDPLWRDAGIPRKDVYSTLQIVLNMTSLQCHVAKFDLETCEKFQDSDFEMHLLDLIIPVETPENEK